MDTHYTHKLTGRRIAVDEKPTREERLYDSLFDFVWRIEHGSTQEQLLDRCRRVKSEFGR